MKSLEITGHKRANLGKSNSRSLRLEGNTPCVLYGGDSQVHFYVPMIYLRDLVYTPNSYVVNLTIDGVVEPCLLQDIQFHPVSEVIMHADFLRIIDNKEVRIDIPVKTKGESPGILSGGKMYIRTRKLRVKGLVQDLPDFIEVDISALELGKTIKVEEIETEKFEILNNGSVSVISVEVPRALRGADDLGEEDEEGLEGEEGAEGAAEAAGAES